MIVRFRLGNVTETLPLHGKLDHHVSAGRKRDGFKQLHVSVEFTKYGNTLFRPVNHPNIVKMKSVCQNPLAIMLEYCYFDFKPFGEDFHFANYRFSFRKLQILIQIDNNYQLDLRNSKFGELIGFTEKIVKKKQNMEMLIFPISQTPLT